MSSEHKFKPFEKVLVRDTAAGDGWRASFFSHYYDGHAVGINGWMFDRMIPYEGNERLLGTTDWPEPELKKGDIVLVWDESKDNKYVRVYSHFDKKYRQHMVYASLFKDGARIEVQGWGHAEKFVPASVEDSAARS